MSIYWWTDKQNLVYSHNGVLLSNKKKYLDWDVAQWYIYKALSLIPSTKQQKQATLEEQEIKHIINMDEPWKRCAKWKKPCII
jgi:hypothetical protein